MPGCEGIGSAALDNIRGTRSLLPLHSMRQIARLVHKQATIGSLLPLSCVCCTLLALLLVVSIT